MSELREECFKCLNNQNCISGADYGSFYCMTRRKLKMPEHEDDSVYATKFAAMQKQIDEKDKKIQELKSDIRKLKIIRTEYDFGYENIHFITKNDLVQIDKNRYLIEVENGKFVDVKKLYYESISKQKVKEALDDIYDYFERLNGPDEDIEYIESKRKELLEKGE